MKCWVRGALVVVLAFGLFVASAGAATPTPTPAGTRVDAASTHAFIALQQQYEIQTSRSASSIRAAEHTFIAQVRTGCPGVLTGLPKKLSKRQGKAVAGFLLESVLTLDINAFAPVRPLINQIAVRQRRLRFSDPALQWQVWVNGAGNAALYALQPPNLCTDGRSLARSAFTRITPAATRFVLAAGTLDLSAVTDPVNLVRRMRPYAPVAVASALKRLPELQRRLVQVISFEAQSNALLRVLGLKHHSTIDFAVPGAGS